MVNLSNKEMSETLRQTSATQLWEAVLSCLNVCTHPAKAASKIYNLSKDIRLTANKHCFFKGVLVEQFDLYYTEMNFTLPTLLSLRTHKTNVHSLSQAKCHMSERIGMQAEMNSGIYHMCNTIIRGLLFTSHYRRYTCINNSKQKQFLLQRRDAREQM